MLIFTSISQGAEWVGSSKDASDHLVPCQRPPKHPHLATKIREFSASGKSASRHLQLDTQDPRPASKNLRFMPQVPKMFRCPSPTEGTSFRCLNILQKKIEVPLYLVMQVAEAEHMKCWPLVLPHYMVKQYCEEGPRFSFKMSFVAVQAADSTDFPVLVVPAAGNERVKAYRFYPINLAHLLAINRV